MASAVSVDMLEDVLSRHEGSSKDMDVAGDRGMVLQLADGSAYEGIGFGAKGKSISGECVFQTGARSRSPWTCRD
jgi:hypothetical protein